MINSCFCRALLPFIFIFFIGQLFNPTGAFTAEYPYAPYGITQENLSQAQKVSFLVFGDSGTGEDAQKRVGQAMASFCKKNSCHFALMLGDNFYPIGVFKAGGHQFEEKFEEPYEGLIDFENFHFWPVMGNHDWIASRFGASPRAQIRYGSQSESWNMPSYHYAVQNLPDWLSIYGLDTQSLIDPDVAERDKNLGREQLKSLTNRPLCQQPSPVRWRLLFGHHALFSGGKKHGDHPKLQKTLKPVIEQCRIQFYLAGHDHHQGHLSTSMIQNTSLEQPLHQLIQGAAAKKREVKDTDYSSERPVKQHFAQSQLGFGHVQVTRQSLKVDFYGVERERAKAHPIYQWQTHFAR